MHPDHRSELYTADDFDDGRSVKVRMDGRLI